MRGKPRNRRPLLTRAIFGESALQETCAAVRCFRQSAPRFLLVSVLTAPSVFIACRSGHPVLAVAYVPAAQAALRDQVAAVYNKNGTVKNGERVEVLDHEKRFARVRTASGIEGWIEQRYLVDQKTYDGVQK